MIDKKELSQNVFDWELYLINYIGESVEYWCLPHEARIPFG